MTTDERMEALAQSMEVPQGMQMDNEKRFAAKPGTNASAHERRISHLEGD